MAHRSILHLDLDAFFVSVERMERLDLRGKPVAVGGRPDERGVVSSASYEARTYGVRSAMPMQAALRLCPELIVLPADHDRYRSVSDEVMKLLHDITPEVEQISIDEAYLDVTGTEQLWGTPEQIAYLLKRRIREQFDLPCSIGVATNKLVAKIATELAKPDGIRVVAPGEEAEFLAPLPVERLWGIGPKVASALRAMGTETIGQLARMPRHGLARRFGARFADEVLRHARGIHTSPVVVNREAKQISQEITFARDVADAERLRRVLLGMSERVAARLRADNVDARTVAIKLRYGDFSTLTRQTTLSEPTHFGQPIYEAAWSLFQKAWTQRPVRLVGVAARNLGQSAQQLSLFDKPDDRQERLVATVDRLRAKYGYDAVRRASLVRKQMRKPKRIP